MESFWTLFNWQVLNPTGFKDFLWSQVKSFFEKISISWISKWNFKKNNFSYQYKTGIFPLFPVSGHAKIRLNPSSIQNFFSYLSETGKTGARVSMAIKSLSKPSSWETTILQMNAALGMIQTDLFITNHKRPTANLGSWSAISY